ncbi:helix-turn-helix transcriptional regulator [Streptomyces zhihengii]|uniref:Helix-turn-helix transcriptional regulator n=1 Tax=Streptomyces zhihengii TaxID=1818004 RepID=A0ABS2UU02_9ACTN|nr:helix-turn-helix transcriptional regulator [Streptomyces zhihengii]MBM9621046.1 helix-turn-helix transcriptional regulator [Streptomyces zhihengii]
MPSRRYPRPPWILARRAAFGHRLALLRQAAGLSQEQLAERALVERRSIIRWELGERDPGHLDLVLLAQALEVTWPDLLGDPPHPSE